MPLASLGESPSIVGQDSDVQAAQLQPTDQVQISQVPGNLGRILAGSFLSKAVDGIDAIPHAVEALDGAVEPLAALTDLARLGFAFHQDGNHIGRQTVDASSSIAGGLLGSLAGKVVGLPIGGAIGCGVGALVGGPIGAVLGGELGGIVGEATGALGLGYAGSQIGESFAQHIHTP